jgi:hypothetical protein
MDMNLDHPFAWNGMPPELLKEAKLLWKLSWTWTISTSKLDWTENINKWREEFYQLPLL